MKPQLVPLLFLLITCSVVSFVPDIQTYAYTGWLKQNNFANYRADNSSGLGLPFLEYHENQVQFMNYYTYSWKALNVSSSDAVISVNLAGQEIIAPSRLYPDGTTKVLNESAVVRVDTDSLRTFNAQGTYIGLWNFWIDPSKYSLANSTTATFTDTWKGTKLTAIVDSCGPNLPPIKTGVGTFYTAFCKSVPPTVVPGVGNIVVTDEYDTNLGLMLQANVGALDDILYSSFQIAQIEGASLVLNSTNIDLHQVVGPSPGQSVNLGLYVIPPLLIAGGLASYWFVMRRALQRKYAPVG